MSENLEIELARHYRTTQERYIYFQIAAAGSAIGFALTQSKLEPLQWLHFPLGVAVAMWAMSFIAGIRVIEYLGSVVFMNYDYLVKKRELLSYETGGVKGFEMLNTLADSVMRVKQKRCAFWRRVQTWCLLLGALSYIVWHGIRMWSLTI